MKKSWAMLPLVALIAALVAAEPVPAPAPAPSAAATASPPVVGGWTPVPRHAPELRAVVRAAVGRIAAGPPAGVLSAERQVVAGANYRIVLVMANGSRWRVVVWQQPDGRLEVTSAERIG